MSLLFTEGFDDGLMTLGKWDSHNLYAAPDASYGRNGKGLMLPRDEYFGRTSIGDQTEIVVGFAVRRTGVGYYGGGNGHNNLLNFYDSAGTILWGSNTTVKAGVWVNSSFQVVGRAPGTNTLTGVSPTSLVEGQWYYIETRIKSTNTGGFFEVKVDGVSLGTITGDLSYVGNTELIRDIWFSGPTTGTSVPSRHYDIDDIYVASVDGTAPNDYIGDIHVQVLHPNGNGNYSQLTGSDADQVDNYLLVDETTPDTADYVESATDGHIDTYTFEDLASAGTVKGVGLSMYTQKSDSGDKSARGVTRISTTDYTGTDQALGTGWGVKRQYWGQNPATAADWTESDVNNAEFGVEVRP